MGNRELRYRWWAVALALLLAALLPPRLGAADEGRGEAFLEEELAAARGRDPYLVLDPAAETLEIRARGLTLHTVALEAVTLLAYRPLRGEVPAVSLPMVLTVDQRPEDTHRKQIAPAALRPFEEGEEEAASGPPPSGPAAAPEVLPDPPAGYEVGMAGGWSLRITQEPPSTGLASRLGRALADGWARLWRRPVARPHLLVLVATADDGRRLHHLFREGIRVLVVS